MGLKYLTDTNVAIDYLDDKLSPHSTHLIDTNDLNMTVITRMELLAWSKATPEQDATIRDFISASTVYPLDEPIILAAIEIRKRSKHKLPDAIIAATALVNDYTLITRNVNDFQNTRGLKVLNPWEM